MNQKNRRARAKAMKRRNNIMRNPMGVESKTEVINILKRINFNARKQLSRR